MRLPSSRFVKEYLVDLNATQAAIRAGYSAKTAYSIGHENLKKPEIAEAIAEARKAIEEKLDITVDMIVRELAKLGFSNMLDYTRITDDGLLAADLSNLTPDRAAAITEVTCESVPIPGGTEGGVVTKTKIKLADKRAALVELGKHLGMFKRVGDSAEHPLHVVEVTDAMRLAAVALLIARVGFAEAVDSVAGAGSSGSVNVQRGLTRLRAGAILDHIPVTDDGQLNADLSNEPVDGSGIAQE